MADGGQIRLIHNDGIGIELRQNVVTALRPTLDLREIGGG